MEIKDSVPATKIMDAIKEIILINFHQIFPPMTLIFNKENLIVKFSNSLLQLITSQIKIKRMSSKNKMSF
jgi:hypothetical protein